MATITISLASTPLTASKTYTLSDADVSRMLAALKTFYAKPAATSAQIAAVWTDDVIDTMKRAVKSAETTLPADITIS